MESNGNVYEILRHEDYKPFVETKGGTGFKADYLSWAVAWDKLKKNFPYATYKVREYVVQNDNIRLTIPYMMLPDKTGIVSIEVELTDATGDCHYHTEVLAIRDYRMSAAVNPDAAQVENTIRRAIAKAVSMLTGFGIELWFGEDIKDLDYRAQTLLDGRRPEQGTITVDQNKKIDKLSRNPNLSDKATKQIKEFLKKDPLPTEKEAENAINQLKTRIEQAKKKKAEKTNETKQANK